MERYLDVVLPALRRRGNDVHVLARFVAAALKGEPLNVYGDWKQTRCFCHVADVVEAIVRLFDSPAAIGQVFNLGSDEEISMNDLAERVIGLSGSSSAIRHISYEEAYGQKFDDMARRGPQLDKIRSVISFQPKRKLDDIVRSVIDEKRQQ